VFLKDWTGFTHLPMKHFKPHEMISVNEGTMSFPGFIPKSFIDGRLHEVLENNFAFINIKSGSGIIKHADEIASIFNQYNLDVAKMFGLNEKLGMDEYLGIDSITDWSHSTLLKTIYMEFLNQENGPSSDDYFVTSLMLINESFRLKGEISLVATIDAVEAHCVGYTIIELSRSRRKQAKKAADVKHAKLRELRHYALENAILINKEKPHLTPHAISKIIKKSVLTKAKEINYPYSEDRIGQTIYGWILKGKDKLLK